MQFRLVTYNIHKGIGGTDRRYRLERIIEVLRHCHCDIVFLQEVDEGVPRSNHDCQIALLAEALGFRYHAYQRNVRLKHGGYGNAFLSRFPLADVENIDLTIRPKKRRRALLAHCRIRFNHHARTLLLANVHLGLSGIERQVQLRRLLKSPMIAHTAGKTPIAIGGDYNDVWGRLGKGILQPLGYSSVGGNIRTFPAVLPVRSLDRIYTRNLVLAQHAFASHTKVARQASDHLPLVVDLKLEMP